MEAAQECDNVLSSRNFYVKTDGKIAHSLNTDTVKYLMKALTSTPTTHVGEAYQEEEGSTIQHHRTLYDFNKVQEAVERLGLKVQQVEVKDLKWILGYETPDRTRQALADLRAPIVVVEENGRLVVIDGLHRLAKAVKQHVNQLPAYVMQRHQLRSARLGLAADLLAK